MSHAPWEPVIVLVETMGPANIGSVARSVAAYGLSTFRLVAPRCQLDENTLKWSCYGRRVLDEIVTYEDLESALADVDLAIALSRRDGKNRHRHYSLPHLDDQVLSHYPSAKRIAFVFGNEESGLAKTHLDLCHSSVEIPTISDDGSLNLSHAVTVTLYECLGRRAARVIEPDPDNPHEQPATTEKLSGLVAQCGELLASVGYPRHRSTLERELVKLESIIFRSQLEDWEVRLLLGMIKQVRYRLEHPVQV